MERKYRFPILMLCVSAALSMAAMGDDKHHEAESGNDIPPGMMMQGGNGMMDMDRMQDQMQAMRETMDRARNENNPEERAHLMQAHMRQMHEMMGRMRGMMGPGSMARNDDESKMKPGTEAKMPMEGRQLMMERRMDLMQQMMEQMMDQMMLQEGSGRAGKKK